MRQGSVWINSASRIVKSDYATSNGVIHYISNMLTPYQLSSKQRISKVALLTIANKCVVGGVVHLILVCLFTFVLFKEHTGTWTELAC